MLEAKSTECLASLVNSLVWPWNMTREIHKFLYLLPIVHCLYSTIHERCYKYANGPW